MQFSANESYKYILYYIEVCNFKFGDNIDDVVFLFKITNFTVLLDFKQLPYCYL